MITSPMLMPIRKRMRSLLGQLRLVFDHAPLHRRGAVHRIDHARKLDQRAVAHQLDDAPVMRGDVGLDELLTQRACRRACVPVSSAAMSRL